MNIERLNTLADFLDTITPEDERAAQFNMNYWANLEGHSESADGVDGITCGFTACALGWATAIPEFKQAGLRLEITDYGSADVRFDGEYATSASMLFFGISRAESHKLFMPDLEDYPEFKSTEDGEGIEGWYEKITPQMVATKIRELVAEAA